MAFSFALVDGVFIISYILSSSQCRYYIRYFKRFLSLEYFDDVNLEDREGILESLTTLAADKDSDVREAACALGRVQPVPPPPEQKEPSPIHLTDGEGEDGDGESVGKEEGEEGVESGPISWAQVAAKQ